MSHVDDGELTAYADGAYPANDPVALRIAAHLSTCGNCRTRLEQSHELRDRAAAILAYATPANVVAPSFETIQAQAATSTRARRRTFPLAWAASIILALGLGWFGRDALQQEVRMADTPVRGDAPMLSTEAKEEAAIATAPPAETPAPVPMAAQSARAQNRARDMAANRAEKEGAGAGAVAGAAPPPSAAPIAAVPPPTPPQAAVSGFSQRLELAEVVVTGEATEYITAAEAERRGIRLARVPELPITRVGLRRGSTIVEQVLPDEKVVTLTMSDPSAGVAETAQQDAAKRRETRAAAAAPATPASVPHIVVMVGDKSVTITGNLSPDSLRALGRKIR